jgi:hypothetical protein
MSRAVHRIRTRLQLHSEKAAAAWDLELYLPHGVVPPAEQFAIEHQVERWTDQVEVGLPGLEELARVLDRPLRPLWVTRSSWPDDGIAGLHSGTSAESPCVPVVCVSASTPIRESASGMSRVADKDGSFVYVQGAGGDEEHWAEGLSPREFWRHVHVIAELLRTRDLTMPELRAEMSMRQTGAAPPIRTLAGSEGIEPFCIAYEPRENGGSVWVGVEHEARRGWTGCLVSLQDSACAEQVRCTCRLNQEDGSDGSGSAQVLTNGIIGACELTGSLPQVCSCVRVQQAGAVSLLADSPKRASTVWSMTWPGLFRSPSVM